MGDLRDDLAELREYVDRGAVATVDSEAVVGLIDRVLEELSGADLALAICAKIRDDGMGSFDKWYIDASVDLTNEEVAFLRGREPAPTFSLPLPESIVMLVGPHGGEPQPCTVVALTDPELPSAVIELATAAGERFGLPVASYLSETGQLP